MAIAPTSTSRRVVVVGSANMDLSVAVERLPRTGETIMGGRWIANPGGKGANQAVAAQRASSAPGACRFIGRVGDDVFGGQMSDALAAADVDAAGLRTSAGESTGVAVILVNPGGDNSIVVSPGANADLCPADIEAARGLIETAGVLVVQLEVPSQAVVAALAIARAAGVTTILDPAPAPRPIAPGRIATLPEGLWQVDIFSPNQTEAELLTGVEVTDLDSARAAGESLLRRGPKIVVLKLGALGAAIVGGEDGEVAFTHVPAIPASAVDTTAAGDSFTGALAAFLAEGLPLKEAVRLACIAGALACEKPGALSSIPARAEIFSRSRA